MGLLVSVEAAAAFNWSVHRRANGLQPAVLQPLSSQLELSHQAACQTGLLFGVFLNMECLATLHTRQNTFRTTTRIERRGRVGPVGAGRGSPG